MVSPYLPSPTCSMTCRQDRDGIEADGLANSVKLPWMQVKPSTSTRNGLKSMNSTGTKAERVLKIRISEPMSVCLCGFRAATQRASQTA